MTAYESFIKATTKSSADKEMNQRLTKGFVKYEIDLAAAKNQFANLKLARERAAYYKWKVLESLDKYLIEFESAVIRRGGKVLWATDAMEACAEVEQIIKRNDAKIISKSKSTLSEEIDLTEYLRNKNHLIIETDTGAYIVDQAKEKPWHMVTPAAHKTVQEIAALLNDKIGVSLDAEPENIVKDIREEIRPKLMDADITITGANFLIADAGMAAITENEGNVRMGIGFAKTHIVVAGIDKIIPSINELDIYWPLLSTFATGQKITSYNSLVGPRQSTDLDGPAEFVVILIDNGRSNVLAQADQRQALSCIKCGACSNVCPVFNTIGGHAYNTAINGPIGAVLNPHMKDIREYIHQSEASSLCGKCTDVCPVNIDLHNHISRNRRDHVQQGNSTKTESLIWYSWKKMMLNRKNINKSVSLKSFMLKSFFKNTWGERREFPKLAEKSFNQLWREQNGL